MNENELLEIQNELQAQEKRLKYILSSKRRIQNMILSFEGDRFVGNFLKLSSQKLFIGAVNSASAI